MDESKVEASKKNDCNDGIRSRLRSIRIRQPATDHRPRRLAVIINPASGREQPVLKILNMALHDAHVDWEIFVTKESCDARRFAKKAVQARADAVVVFGGDGTVNEVASALVRTNIPLGIIPGGTMNVMASEMKIPTRLEEACVLAVNPPENIRVVDVGKIGRNYFLLRAATGFQAESVDGADRSLKNRFGVLAYALAGLQLIADPPVSRYTLTLDGQVEECEGVTCIVANSGATWLSGISLAPTIDTCDGLLDVIVVRKADLPSLISLAASVVAGSENPQALLHWQVKRAAITADPTQKVQADGEMIGQTPIRVNVVPRALGVIVPPDETGR